MLCGSFAVIAVPCVLGFAPVVLKCRSINGLNLLFKAVDVGAEFCGELNLTLFGAGRLFESLGGDSCIFGVNMVVVVLANNLSGEGAVVCAPLIGGLAPLMADCRDFNGLFGRCELGKGCGVLALALYVAGCCFNNAVNGVYGFGFGVARIAFAGMLCGNFAVIAVPCVLGFTPVMTEHRIFNYGSLSGEAVLVLAKLCGVGYFALFFAGRVLGYGGGVHLFGVNMVAVVLTDYLSGEGAVVCAPLIGGLAPLMADCRDFNGLFGRCELGKGCGIFTLALFFAGGRFNNAVNWFYGFLLNLVGIIEGCMNRSNGAVILVPCICSFAPILPCKDGIAAVDICAVRMEACTKECDHFGSFHFGFGFCSAEAGSFTIAGAVLEIIAVYNGIRFGGVGDCAASGSTNYSADIVAVGYLRALSLLRAGIRNTGGYAVCSSRSYIADIVAVGNGYGFKLRICQNTCHLGRSGYIHCGEAAADYGVFISICN